MRAGSSRPGRRPGSSPDSRSTVMSPQGTFTSALDDPRRPARGGDRRRFRHHAPDGSRAHGADPFGVLAVHPALHEPRHARRDVPGRPRRPQGPVSDATRAAPCALPRAAGGPGALGPDRRGEAADDPSARSSLRPPSTSGSSADRSPWSTSAARCWPMSASTARTSASSSSRPATSPRARPDRCRCAPARRTVRIEVTSTVSHRRSRARSMRTSRY